VAHRAGSSSGDVILASRSQDKAREIRDILGSSLRSRIITLDEAGIAENAAEELIEVHETFLENAHAKAEYFMRITGIATLADDSGICVHALDGHPGVRSRRFAWRHGLGGTDLDRANNELLLERLRDTPDEQRGAHYACAAVLHLPDGRRFSAIGTCAGSILHEPQGTGGFGYDPLFLVPEVGLSFGQVDRAEKQRHSHRARAFRALAGCVPVGALDSRASRPHP
jgi:XTP/dITP diphosphohydrolase